MVEKTKLTEYPLRGLSMPLDSGLNPDYLIQDYFSKRTPSVWEKASLREKHPLVYNKIIKNLEKDLE